MSLFQAHDSPSRPTTPRPSTPPTPSNWEARALVAEARAREAQAETRAQVAETRAQVAIAAAQLETERLRAQLSDVRAQARIAELERAQLSAAAAQAAAAAPAAATARAAAPAAAPAVGPATVSFGVVGPLHPRTDSCTDSGQPQCRCGRRRCCPRRTAEPHTGDGVAAAVTNGLKSGRVRSFALFRTGRTPYGKRAPPPFRNDGRIGHACIRKEWLK